MDYNSIVIHYGEVTLKRGRRSLFERILARNLEEATGVRVRRIQGRMVMPYRENALDKLGKVFGVVWYAPAIHVEGGYEELEDTVIKILGRLSPKSFKIDTRRSDKRFPMTSIEVSSRIGARVRDTYGFRVDLKNPERTVVIEITEEGFYVSYERFQGPGGLPVGSSGRVLALLSGGIDSPVAAWMMMKRGCRVDALHFHALRSSEEVLQSKMLTLAKILAEYGLRLRLYLAPFHSFYEKSLGMPPRMELVMFRVWMLKLAERLAERENYLGIVTGDSLGQVASQTLENLHAASSMLRIPVYRPLIGLDKQEIIGLAERIGTYQVSIQEYKDCCSIVARHPETRATPERVRELWERFNLSESVEEALEEVEAFLVTHRGELKPIHAAAQES